MKGEWPAEETQFLVDNYRAVTNVDLAKYLKRSPVSVKNKIATLGLDQPRMVYAHRVPRPNSEEAATMMLKRATFQHLLDLKRGGYPSAGPTELRIGRDSVPFRVQPTSSPFSPLGSPAGMCADLAR